MRPQQVTDGIVLGRIDYGEADRIITLLTPDHGKLRLIAKGVRRVRSKLAGGIELFSVTNIIFIAGRGDIGTLVSSRLTRHYGRIVQDIDRTMLGYELIKQLDKATEDHPEPSYFQLLDQAFAALDDAVVPADLIRLWFTAQLIGLGGHTPNLQAEPDGTKLAVGQQYEFSFDDSAFVARPGAPYGTAQIKFLRLVFSGTQPAALARIADVTSLTRATGQLVSMMQRRYSQ